MARVGILGGTFNPPHIGHLVCAREAMEQLGLEQILLMPAAIPPHKTVADDPGPPERLELCSLATAGEQGLATTDVEVRRSGPSYTVDSLRQLRAAAPADEFTLIVGGDMAASFATWHAPQEILALARLAVVERADTDRESIARSLSHVDGTPGRNVFFEMPRLDISSSLLRHRLAEGRSVRHLIPDAVLEVIIDRGYYSARPSAYPGG